MTRPRTGLLLGLGLGVLLLSSTAEAQPAGTVWRVGVLMLERSGYVEALLEGLRALGYVEGRNLALERRLAKSEEQLPGLAAELVRLNPHVIVAVTGRATRALRDATQSIPIVMATSGDAVAGGLVTSLARPGGNVTGVTNASSDLAAKRLQILKEIVPRAARIGVMRCEGATSTGEWPEVQSAARRLGLQLVPMLLRHPEAVPGSLEDAKRQKVDAILVLDCSILPSPEALTDLLNGSGVPAGYPYARFARAGGLASYGPNIEQQIRHAAVFVDRILKGARPADLPVEQPTKFELVVNLKTAKALRIAIPQSVLARADQVLE